MGKPREFTYPSTCPMRRAGTALPTDHFRIPGSVRELGVSLLSRHLGGANRFKTLKGLVELSAD